MLARPKFACPADEIAAVFAMFRGQGEFIVPTASGTVLVDPGDTKFLQCAETAQADYLITGNKRANSLAGLDGLVTVAVHIELNHSRTSAPTGQSLEDAPSKDSVTS